MFKVLGLSIVLLLLVACGQPPRDYLQRGTTSDNARTQAPAAQVGARDCSGTNYTVVLHDTLGEIALRCGVSVNQLIGVNNLTPPYIIYPKQELIIPRAAMATPKIKKSANSVTWHWPLDHKTHYAYVLDSQGVQALEVYGEVGALVRAAADGEVAFAENASGPLGNMVMIRHADNYLSIYAHNQRLHVKQGDQVKAGDVIANLGQSGRTDRPKLYFELRYQGRKMAVEPLLGKP
ncbi:M23 family metallopeptidase [Thiomicrospira microaerophila]|uniref:M23 family metallopeptidase n=1 Tax=Thiomicrospira microaerophila TaxID=406020 RepID=UPI000697D364|nr:M23 family metallopeptidase [Thiomicrospira microaerophila]